MRMIIKNKFAIILLFYNYNDRESVEQCSTNIPLINVNCLVDYCWINYYCLSFVSCINLCNICTIIVKVESSTIDAILDNKVDVMDYTAAFTTEEV